MNLPKAENSSGFLIIYDIKDIIILILSIILVLVLIIYMKNYLFC